MLEWRTLDWLPSYEISEDGRLRRKYKIHSHPEGRELMGSLSPKGYLRYFVYAGGRRRYVLANRLVCEAWHGPSPAGKNHAAHNDGDSLRNHFSNLRWASPAENNADKDLHGTKMTGERHYAAKLTEADVRKIRAQHGMVTISQMSRDFKVSRMAIQSIFAGKTWKEVV